MNVKKMIYDLSKDGVIFQVFRDDQDKVRIRCGDRDNITCIVGDSNEEVFLSLASYVSKLNSEKSILTVVKPLIEKDEKD